MNLKQINKFHGSEVKVEMRNGNVIEGTLAFFNYDEQVIHLNNYKEFILIKEDGLEDCFKEIPEEGQMMVINKYSWFTLKIDGVDEEIKADY